MSPALKKLVIYSSIVLTLSVVYYVYAITKLAPSPEQETFLSELGEGIGEIAMWVFVFIYCRTLLKLTLGKGPIARRLLPNYKAPKAGSYVQKIVVSLDRSHVYFGIAALALALIHIALMGLHVEIIFFPLVLALVMWQGLFGMFISWRGAPRDIKKWSYAVHAQLFTGVAIGVFAFFGHTLIDN